MMKRREFISLLGGAAAWPLAARAQQSAMPVIGFLGGPTAKGRASLIAAFQKGLTEVGYSEGRQIDTRWATTDAEQVRKQALELAALAPDVILAASGTTTVAPLLQATRTVPIVFVVVIDPVGAGFVANLARPGGNATGFLMFEYGLSGKWLERLKQTAPGLKRVAVLRDPTIASGIGQFGAIQSAAPSLGLEAIPVNVRDEGDIERDITALARSPNGGVVVTSSPEASRHRHLIITLAARHGLPAIYSYRSFAVEGGLISYGPDMVDQYRRAAAYVDRILKGEKPTDLPVQAPTKYELVINVTAKALGLDLPPALLASADEVIE
jgi:putative tryptophan/tyrosine transport system substrate-binding protein